MNLSGFGGCPFFTRIFYKNVIGGNHHIAESLKSLGCPVGTIDVALDVAVQIGNVHEVVVVIGFHQHLFIHRHGYFASFLASVRMCLADDLNLSCHHVPLTYHLVERLEAGGNDDGTITQGVMDVDDLIRELVILDVCLELMAIPVGHGNDAVHVVTQYLVLSIVGHIEFLSAFVCKDLSHVGEFVGTFSFGACTGNVVEILLVEQMDSPFPCFVVLYNKVVFCIECSGSSTYQHGVFRVDFLYLTFDIHDIVSATLVLLFFVLGSTST